MYGKRTTKAMTHPLRGGLFWATFALGTAILLAPVLGHAFDASDIRVNGFASQGYIKSGGNNFLVPESVDGSYEVNEVGVTVNAQVNAKLRVGAQLLSRDLGAEGNNETKLDWGYGDYRLHDALGFRFGKVKMPYGLYNEGRDSDFLRATAYLPQSIYTERRRDFMVAGVGAELYGNITAGGLGDFDYKVFSGDVNVNRDIDLIEQEWRDAANQVLPLGLAKFEVESEGVDFFALVYNTPLEGLRVGMTYGNGGISMTARAYDYTASILPVNDARLDVTVDQEDMTVYSAEYATPWFTLATEYHTYTEKFYSLLQSPTVGPLDAPSTAENNIESFYYMVSAPIPGFEQLTLSASYDEYRYDEDDYSSPSRHQKDTGFGFRYDVSSNMIVKAEWHGVEGYGQLSRVLNDSFEDNWDYMVVKTSFVF